MASVTGLTIDDCSDLIPGFSIRIGDLLDRL
jgi:hypothetical protein